MIAEVAAGLLGGLLALGVWERRQRDLARAAIPTRIHVNGTRGKSTVTRLIAAALRASGRPTIAKTTGTAARLILTDGSEVPIRRRAMPNIREQLWLLRQARRHGARAAVVECMAIDPVLQGVSEHDMISATIGVVTNARSDHADVMGDTMDAVATALATTVPTGGTVILGPDLDQPVFADTARQRGTRVIRADRQAVRALTSTPLPAWRVDNLAIALAVTRALQVPDEVAWPAMLSATEDPGAMSQRACTVAGRTRTMIDGAAANDPESLQMLLDSMPDAGARLFVFNHRADRPLRLRQFAHAPVWQHPQVSVLVTGDTPDCATRRVVGRAIDSVRLGFAPVRVLARTLREQLARDDAITSVIFCGNTRHLNVPALTAALADPDSRSQGPDPSCPEA